MKRIFKNALSVLLAVLMVTSIIPFSCFVHASAASLGYLVGDIIEFGSYPQSEVTDSALVAALKEQPLEWISYGYYSGSGELGSMAESDYMKYADVEYNGEKYRAVTFSKYRPNQRTGRRFLLLKKICYNTLFIMFNAVKRIRCIFFAFRIGFVCSKAGD